jgi:rRNA processing protein Gar1
LKGWVKLNLHYLGESKKHQIFRVKNWNKNLEKIYNKPIYNENYEELGNIKEIFGPIKLPFISIKTLPERELNPEKDFYVKL